MNRYCKLFALLLLGGCFWAARAEAHSIYVFAYPDNAQICSNSYFGGKAKVRGGQITMIAATGEVLATAVTDENGDACFVKPETAQDLLFIVEAGGGHRGEFTLPASEIRPAAARVAEPPRAEATAPPAALPGPSSGLTRDDLQEAVAPLMMKLAEMESAQNSRVTSGDVIGGLGWLIGLAGAALWAGARKK